jgi:hypothetical protein
LNIFCEAPINSVGHRSDGRSEAKIDGWMLACAGMKNVSTILSFGSTEA